MTEFGEVQVLDAADGPPLTIVEGKGSAYAIVWPGMGARHRSLHRIRLGVGARTAELRHPMEAVYYVLGGSGSVVDSGDGSRQDLVEGSMVHVEPGTAYRFEAGGEPVELIGGPCPPDPALYREAES